jgi:hypothetical protein
MENGLNKHKDRIIELEEEIEDLHKEREVIINNLETRIAELEYELENK